MEKREDLRELRNEDNHNCFGCGTTNAHGLRMKFYTDGQSLFSWVTVPGHLCGWDNLVHGGVLATILDEIMGWTAIHTLKKFTLTRAMSVEYLKPVHVGEQVRVQGKVIAVKGTREATVEGHLYKGADTLCAKATGTFRLFTAESMVRLGIVGKEALKRFDYLVEP